MIDDLVSINVSIQGVNHTLSMNEAEKLYEMLQRIFEKEVVISPITLPYDSPKSPQIPFYPQYTPWVTCHDTTEVCQ